MAGSAAEREIRDAVAAFIRCNMPDARVVHELVVGQCRADLAAVESERLTLFEIKSSKDKLTRLERQHRMFTRAAHETIVVADRKWFEEFTYERSEARGYRAGPGLECVSILNLWRFPQPEPGEFAYHDRWRLPRVTMEQPHAQRMLDLLWADELRAECLRHNISASSRTNRFTMMTDMAWLLTGKEIARAVCRQLRGRAFPEADAPIIERAAAV
jgi:hypothetical protein